MLRRVKISGYKSLVDLEVRLQPLSVLFGPNAAGKSNFLDALQLLSRVVTSRTLKEAFVPPFRGTPLESFTFVPGGIKGLLDRDSVSFAMEVDVELSQSVVDAVNRQIREMKQTRASDGPDANGKPQSYVRERHLRYRIEVEILPRSGILRVTDEYLTALNARGEPRKDRRPFLELVDRQLHLRMEGQAHPAYYERYLDHSILSLPLYPPHYPHLVAMRQELSGWLFFYFEPRERMRAPNPVKEVRHVGLMGEDLAAFLNTLRALDPRQFRGVEKSLQTIIPSITGIDVEVSSVGEVELRLMEDGTPIPARVVSEGTLRILGLLALSGVKEAPSLVGLEEPENGVHPRRVRLIAELLESRANGGNTQLVVTTHSPILPDLIPDESLYVCRKIGGKTRIEPFSPTWGPLGRASDVEQALDGELPAPSVSERIQRGDFDD
jgi:predicted ATPase